MRLFIAFSLPESAVKACNALQEAMRNRLSEAPIQWTPPENLHITVDFLGEVEDRKLLQLEEAFSYHSGHKQRVSFSFGSFTAFPSLSRPQSLVVEAPIEPWAAVLKWRQGIHEELRLRSLVEGGNEWKPHITLGRTKGPVRLSQETLAGIIPEKFSWTTDQFHLMRSDLTDHGSQYSVLKTFSL